ncbi:MAG: ribulose-phosphate 3-epimerase [Planctomycetota bacterium]|nr:ribulose-phosphate 3-epimerase [Planctomycetota bacterium]
MSHPIRIAPSLLAADFSRLAEEVRDVEQAGADWLHLDVMDGHFVPNLTFGPFIVDAIHKVASKPLDVHLMITDPWKYCDRFLEAGADVLTFHVEVEENGDAPALIDRIQQHGSKAGMSLQPNTPVERLQPYVDKLDVVLIMSVFAGFGGQSFMPDVLPKAVALRAMGFRGEIAMDGGIDPKTIGQSAAAGTNVFVAGTAVFGAKDRAARILELRELAVAAQRAGQTEQA